MNRRKVLTWSAAGLGTAIAVPAGGFGILYSTYRTDTFDDVDFDNELTVPPLAESTVKNGVRHFELDIQTGTTAFKPGGKTDTWGVNGSYLGPTVRLRRGEDASFSVRNHLDEDTTVHWHGAHLPAAVDGGPHQSIAPGDTWEAEWTADQNAATLWYHPHPHGRTARHVYRGLAGMLLIDDDISDALPLPHRYGIDDVPLIVQDRTFSSDNQFEEDSSFMNTSGIMGDEILVNGTYGPYFSVTTKKARLRLLNASNSRVYNFGFSDDRSFQLIATDGGLRSKPLPTERIALSPGERAEIIVDFKEDETVDLRSFPAELGYGFPFQRFNGMDDRFDILRFKAADSLDDSPELPATLVDMPDLNADNPTTTREFDLHGMNQINNKTMDMQRIDFGVRVDTTEVWTVRNRVPFLHNFHVHDVQFQVIDVDGAAPPEHLRGWKDTIALEPDLPYRLAMRFTDYTDPDLPYMYHCHILRHEDMGMMGQFVVLGDNEDVGTVPMN
ncbi:multicopper oxidase family protein [Haloglycomyces albus]|uniref:multicopper oxidase family protein n=1 Tax=Haloglycomyces albus TaxID=526067 RepID=UPI00046D6C73|nr:multicopper oxidase domain-containing protein [Haloglycomyces albus]